MSVVCGVGRGGVRRDGVGLGMMGWDSIGYDNIGLDGPEVGWSVGPSLAKLVW